MVKRDPHLDTEMSSGIYVYVIFNDTLVLAYDALIASWKCNAFRAVVNLIGEEIMFLGDS